MLSITRREGESLMIGKDILINIYKVEDGRARIAIHAPRNLKILREEHLVNDANFHALRELSGLSKSTRLKETEQASRRGLAS